MPLAPPVSLLASGWDLGWNRRWSRRVWEEVFRENTKRFSPMSHKYVYPMGIVQIGGLA
jgi:hypothetical protein